MSDSPAGRKVVNAHMTPLLPYDMEGPVQPGGLPDRRLRMGQGRPGCEWSVDATPPRSGGLQGSSRDRNLHSQISVLRNEKGGVVRRPFSKLQAWLIAVSPQPGVAPAIGNDRQSLEHGRRDSAALGGDAAAQRTPSGTLAFWDSR